MQPETAEPRPALDLHPLTPERWPDLEKLFGPNGAYAGCWCMWFRLRRKQFSQQTGEQRKEGLKSLVDAGEPPGLLGYVQGEPVGWVSLGPRQRFPHIEHSRKLKRVDGRPVWSIVCFVIDRRFRRQGLMTRLLRAAVDYAREHGAEVVEAYPVEAEGQLAGYSGYTGIASTLRRAGFVEVARASERQVIMRSYVT